MTLLLAAILIIKLVCDAIIIFFANVSVKSHNPYLEYRKHMNNHKENRK